jgi:hypothetical protein
MITKVKEIKTISPRKSIWKYIRYFLDTERTAEKLRIIHNISGSEHDANLKKQAKQIAYCITQAEEYFNAANETSLATKPLLLYYGAVALGNALFLLKLDGSYSLDALRASKKHNHHGLELIGFSDSSKTMSSAGVFDWLGECKAKINFTNSQPWGQFPLFYKALMPSSVKIKTRTSKTEKRGQLEGFEPQVCADITPIESLADIVFNGADIVKILPDCYNSTLELNEWSNLCRGSLNIRRTVHARNENNKEIIDKISDVHTAGLDGISLEQKNTIIEFYKSVKSPFALVTDYGSNIILEAKMETDAEGNYPKIYYPDLVDDLNGRLFYIINPKGYIQEPASMYVFLFIFGMLCRYYPDIWMKVIGENILMREFIDEVFDTIERKFPNLVLDQLTGIKHYVSS